MTVDTAYLASTLIRFVVFCDADVGKKDAGEQTEHLRMQLGTEGLTKNSSLEKHRYPPIGLTDEYPQNAPGKTDKG